MQTLFQSAFLQSLGLAIANSLWQMALLWLVYFLVSHIFRLSSAAKYRVAVAAQITGFIWFVITIQFYHGQYTEALRNSSSLLPVSQNIQAIIAGEQGFASQLIRYMVKAEQVLPFVSVAYLLLILVLCIRWVNAYRKTQAVRTQGLQKIPVDWRLFVKRIASQLGIRKDIRLFLSETVTTPLTIGFLKPMILIPVASINHLSTQQLEAVLLHELAHIKRYDYLINILLSVVEISLFFNPFTQLLSRHIRKERENSCDDWVLQFEYKASEYAEALLRIAYLQHTPAFAMAATGKKNDLLGRVKRMIGEKENQFNYRRQLLALIMVTGMLGCIAWLNPAATAKGTRQPAAVAQTKALSQKQTVVEPMAVKVDNPLFNPMFFLSAPLKKEMRKNLDAAQEELRSLVTPDSDHAGLIESIPPMVANALEMAAIGFDEKNKTISKELSEMKTARINLEKIIADSLSIPLPFRSAVKDEFARSLQSVQADIEKAKTEIENFALIKDKMLFDQEKVKKDINNAMEELKGVGLDKLVFNSFKMAGMPLGEKKRSPKTKKQAATSPDEKKNFEEPVTEKPGSLFREISMPVIDLEERRSLRVITITPAFIKELRSIAEMLKQAPLENLDPVSEQQLRKKLELLQKIFSRKSNLVKTVCTEDAAEEEEDTVVTRTQ